MGLSAILSAFGRALAQAGDARFLRVLLLGLGLTVALFAGLGVAAWLGVGWLVPDGWGPGWLDEAGGALAVAGVLVASVFLMVPVAAAFGGIFLDDVAAAVEARHYPRLPPARGVPVLEGLRDGAGLFGALVALNLLAFLLSFLLGPLSPVLFWLVNGWLLGREYFQLVALRRVGWAEASAARRRHAGKVWLAGTLMAAPLSIPLVNLVVPVLGAATFTHLYHAFEGPRRG